MCNVREEYIPLDALNRGDLIVVEFHDPCHGQDFWSGKFLCLDTVDRVTYLVLDRNPRHLADCIPTRSIIGICLRGAAETT